MDAQDKAAQTAQEVAGSRTVELLGRVGMVSRGVLLVTLGAVCVGVVIGRGSDAADSRGALQALVGSLPGALIVGACAAGFAAQALWRWAEAAGGLRGDDGARGGGKRLGYVVAGIVDAALAVVAVSVLAGRSEKKDENTRSRDAAGHLFGLPLGRPLLALVGVVLVGSGIAVAVWTVRGGCFKRLRMDRLHEPVRRAVRILEPAGQLARAVLLLTAGGIVIRAALESRPDEATGMDGTLRTLTGAPLGSLLLVAVGLCIAGLGLASFAETPALRTSGDTG